MGSPPNSQQSSAGPVCLSLLKFSYATVPMNSIAPVPWTHISSKNNLFAIFETARTRGIDGTVEERQKFKVLRDPEVMEELDLGVLAHEAQQALVVTKDAHQHNQDQYVAIIVKTPVIAMKYPMKGGQVRRFQIRFAGDEYYYDAMKLLSRAQVPTIEAGTFPPRPQTAAPIGSFNKSGIPSGDNVQLSTRPVSAAPNLSAVHSVSNATASSERAANVPQRHVTVASSMMPPPSHFPSPVKHGLPHPQHLQNQGDVSWNSTIDQTENVSDLARDKGHMSLDSQPRNAIELYTPRPSAAPATTSQHFSQLLPPKRELPFEKAKAESRPSSSRVLRSATKDSAEPEATSTRTKNIVNKPKRAPPRKPASESPQGTTQKRKHNYIKSSSKASDVAEPAAKKGRKAETGAATAATEDPLPSIEEILKDDEAKALHHNQKSMDTQALLSRAEGVCSSGLAGLQPNMSLPIKPSSVDTTLSGIEVSGTQSYPVPTSPTKTATNTFPCTPANQMINPSTPAAPVAQHTVDAAPAPASPGNALHAFADAYSLLLRNPRFANSDPYLYLWAAQPEQLQLEALQRYMCEQYEDESGNFSQLCKMMERTWEASIVWPEVYKRSSAGMS